MSESRRIGRLFCLPLSLHSIKASQRRAIAFDDDRLASAYENFLVAHATAGSEAMGLVIVSTCERTDLYVSAPAAADARHAIDFSLNRGMDDGEPLSHASMLEGVEAVRHLCAVAAGLESTVVGEAEILGQVRHDFRVATAAGSVDTILHEAFSAALRAGKKAQSGGSSESLGSVAGRQAAKFLGGSPEKRALIIGSGAMSTDAAAALARGWSGPMTIVNRTLSRARKLAMKVGADSAPLGRLPRLVSDADLVITAVTSRQPILSESALRLATDGSRKLVVIDIGHPPNVDEPVQGIPGVEFVRIEDLQAGFRRDDSSKWVNRAAEAVDSEVDEFSRRIGRHKVGPTIAGFRSKVLAAGEDELERTLRRRPDLDHGQRDELRRFARSLLMKVIHEPTVNIQRLAMAEDGDAQIEVIRRLYGLDQPDPEFSREES